MQDAELSYMYVTQLSILHNLHDKADQHMG